MREYVLIDDDDEDYRPRKKSRKKRSEPRERNNLVLGWTVLLFILGAIAWSIMAYPPK